MEKYRLMAHCNLEEYRYYRKTTLIMQIDKRRYALLLCAVMGIAPAALKAQSVPLSPGYLNVGVTQQVQYTTTVTGLANTTVKWEVSGVAGGNSTLGTITQTGLYTAPATVPTASADGEHID